MRGRSTIKKPKLTLDSKYQDILISKLINKVMWEGKRSTAERIVYSALEKLALEVGSEPRALLRDIVEKGAPILAVRSRRVGGATYQVPVEVKPARKIVLVIRWLLDVCRNQQGKAMDGLLYQEAKNILDNTSSVMKKREDLHYMPQANLASADLARY